MNVRESPLISLRKWIAAGLESLVSCPVHVCCTGNLDCIACFATILVTALAHPAVPLSAGFSTYRAFDRWDHTSPIQRGEDMNQRDQAVRLG